LRTAARRTEGWATRHLEFRGRSSTKSEKNEGREKGYGNPTSVFKAIAGEW